MWPLSETEMKKTVETKGQAFFSFSFFNRLSLSLREHKVSNCTCEEAGKQNNRHYI